RVLRGPNLWCRQTIIEAIVTCDAAEQLMGGNLDDFETRVRARFPDIDMIHPPGQEPTSAVVHALTAAALCLQTRVGCPLAYRRITPTRDTGVYQIAVEYAEEAVGLLALQLAEQLCSAALSHTAFN